VAVSGCDFCGLAPIEAETIGFVTVVPQGFVSSYVLDVGGGKLVLIDAGSNADATEITDALEAKGKSLADVEAIVLTHGHTDHIAGLETLTGVPVWAHPGVTAQLGEEVGAALAGELVDGEAVTFGERAFSVYHMPGHSPGSVSLLVDGMLFFGDNAASTDQGGVRLVPENFTDDVDQNRQDLRELVGKLEGVEVDTMFFSHSGPLQGKAPLEEYVAGL
jgi:glyoxylase-like metal-dependent hydrolase (beta-lactamase superfamily II)